ncbi:sulfite oxidase [Pseudarthrobacter albicanus]|uniref:sulfite oxidase n=1 Tax=Pseudarthrobacter albicanus TaxID=2823873 RepID=UPI001BA5C9D2|nr:sulfite oxidase [Pseudarthrobacter albicanus]
MALFVVHHQHSADRCPTQDPYMGAMLLNHLSRPNARQYGVEIQGEAVVQGEHTLYFIAEAGDENRLREFMQAFQEVGSLDVYPASTCARVVAGGGCATPMPMSGSAPAIDPADACQQAMEAGLVVQRAHPLNCETPIPALIGGAAVPNAHFYVRNHFQIPNLDPSVFRLEVGGLVERELSLSVDDLHNLPSQTLTVTLECAGNGRALFEPPIEGEKWNLGAVSTAEWTGVPLMEVLDRAGVRPSGREVLFRGADGGTVAGHSGPVCFERSLRLDQCRDADLLLAYAMNGEPLPLQHGYPLRLVVPDWYAVASVKWLTGIELLDRPFRGHYQHDKYWYEWERDGEPVREPATLQRVRALITEPAPEHQTPRGDVAIRGVAWSGAAAIDRVEVSVGGGGWQQARLVGERRRHSWQPWELIISVLEPGMLTVQARATDLAGRTQPERAEWNRLGYGNNAIHQVEVRIL